MSGLRGRVPAVLGGCLVLALACGEGPSGPTVAGVCLAGVQVNGLFYVLEDSLPATSTVGPEVAEVLRNVGCNDTPDGGRSEPGVSRDGDSNVLPAGTPLHAITGRDVGEVLTAPSPQAGWVVLRVIG